MRLSRSPRRADDLADIEGKIYARLISGISRHLRLPLYVSLGMLTQQERRARTPARRAHRLADIATRFAFHCQRKAGYKDMSSREIIAAYAMRSLDGYKRFMISASALADCDAGHFAGFMREMRRRQQFDTTRIFDGALRDCARTIVGDWPSGHFIFCVATCLIYGAADFYTRLAGAVKRPMMIITCLISLSRLAAIAMLIIITPQRVSRGFFLTLSLLRGCNALQTWDARRRHFRREEALTPRQSLVVIWRLRAAAHARAASRMPQS